MGVHISCAQPGAISRADFIGLPAAELVGWLDEYYAHYGTFEIDESASVVTHRIVNSLLPYETAATLSAMSRFRETLSWRAKFVNSTFGTAPIIFDK